MHKAVVDFGKLCNQLHRFVTLRFTGIQHILDGAVVDSFQIDRPEILKIAVILIKLGAADARRLQQLGHRHLRHHPVEKLDKGQNKIVMELHASAAPGAKLNGYVFKKGF